MFRSAQHDRRRKRFNTLALQRNDSLRFQHECKIDVFPFCDIKAAGREKFPVWRLVSEQRPGIRRRQNNKTRTWRGHEFCGAAPVERRKKTFHARPKVPDQARLVELHRGKLHVGFQSDARLLKELICGKKPSFFFFLYVVDRDLHTRSGDGDCHKQGAAACSRHWRRLQKRRSLPVTRE